MKTCAVTKFRSNAVSPLIFKVYLQIQYFNFIKVSLRKKTENVEKLNIFLQSVQKNVYMPLFSDYLRYNHTKDVIILGILSYFRI